MGRVYLVRHGETEWNAGARYQGHTDVPLSATGRAQAERLRLRLQEERLDAAYSSDLSRAQETAQILLWGREVPLIPRPELREIAYGAWEGLSHAEILGRDRASFHEWGDNPWAYFPPDGEPFPSFLERVRSCYEELLPQFREQNVVLVAHGGPLRTILCLLLGLSPGPWRFGLEPASLSVVEVYPFGGVVLSLLNERCHLEEAIP